MISHLLSFQHLRTCLVILLVATSTSLNAQDDKIAAPDGLDPTSFAFISLLFQDDLALTEPMNHIEQNWQPSFVAMALDVLSLNRRPGVHHWMFKLLREKTGQNHGNNLIKKSKSLWASRR